MGREGGGGRRGLPVCSRVSDAGAGLRVMKQERNWVLLPSCTPCWEAVTNDCKNRCAKLREAAMCPAGIGREEGRAGGRCLRQDQRVDAAVDEICISAQAK